MLTGFPGGASDKESTCQGRRCKKPTFDTWVGKIPWNRKWQPTAGFLPGKFHGKRSLVGYSPMGLQRVRHDWATEHAHSVYQTKLGRAQKGVFFLLYLYIFIYWFIYVFFSSHRALLSRKGHWHFSPILIYPSDTLTPLADWTSDFLSWLSGPGQAELLETQWDSLSPGHAASHAPPRCKPTALLTYPLFSPVPITPYIPHEQGQSLSHLCVLTVSPHCLLQDSFKAVIVEVKNSSTKICCPDSAWWLECRECKEAWSTSPRPPGARWTLGPGVWASLGPDWSWQTTGSSMLREAGGFEMVEKVIGY